ncbi:unnamed protein product [Prorocentrum cordatum]|uniref:Uncharacterized protein n=1 Tax=Prorocentrum cordatum TaxID=2364126 RepID=A0ABN9S2N0_9DINO|nr:unnamed protein product [Polarella glacialis]
MYVFSTCVGSHTSSQNHRVLLAGSSFSGAHAHICVITHGVCKPLQILACVCECMCTSMSPAAALHRHPRVRQRRRQEEGEDHARGRTGGGCRGKDDEEEGEQAKGPPRQSVPMQIGTSRRGGPLGMSTRHCSS